RRPQYPIIPSRELPPILRLASHLRRSRTAAAREMVAAVVPPRRVGAVETPTELRARPTVLAPPMCISRAAAVRAAQAITGPMAAAGAVTPAAQPPARAGMAGPLTFLTTPISRSTAAPEATSAGAWPGAWPVTAVGGQAQPQER